MALSISRIVNVVVSLLQTSAARRSFNSLLIAGDSDVISGKERLREYSTYDAVAEDFGVDAPESQAAALYYGQTPKPKTLFIGRWLRIASSGFNKGAVLTAAQQLITNWSSISAGSFTVFVDGVSHAVTGLDFTGAPTLNYVASVINSAISAYATCIYDGSRFIITSNSTGAGAKAIGSIESLGNNLSYGAKASGTITLTGNPDNGDDVEIQGTTVTFVTGSPTGNQVLIGMTNLITAANLQTFLQNSSDDNLSLMTYNTINNVTTVTDRYYEAAGDSYTLVKSGANISLSGANLSGGADPDTLTVNGYPFVFIPASIDTGEVNTVVVGTTNTATWANIQSKLSASVDSDVALASYALDVSGANPVVNITYKVVGEDGNDFTLAKSAVEMDISGAFLTGGAEASVVSYTTLQGSGTDISSQLKTNSGNGILVSGYDSETPAECTVALANKSANWYGLMFAYELTDENSLAVSEVIEALDLKRLYGVTISDTNVLDSEVTDDLASTMKDAGYLQSMCQYSSSSIYAIASLFGRMFSVNFAANRSTITLMFKQEPGVTGEDLTETQANTLKNKRCNVLAEYVNDTVIIQYGVMSGDRWIDETHGLDWLQNAIQTNCYNALYTSGTKVPQTDQGVNKLVNAVNQSCGEGVNNGLIAPGVWNGDELGQIKTGDYLKAGYYTFAESVDLQAQSDRDARVSPPIQSAIKLAGAIQSLDVFVTVNR